MSTLTIMKARVASELRRSDLTSQIAYAITDAIEKYQAERFFFNESRSVTFNTIANTEFYTEVNAPGIASFAKIDFVVLRDGDIIYSLDDKSPEEIEVDSENATMTGMPGNYCYYGEQLRLYPVPDAIYPIRAGILKIIDAPASDSEANNPWMTHAKALIRAEAKYQLALHVIRDRELAGDMQAAAEIALADLRRATTKRTKSRGSRVAAMEF